MPYGACYLQLHVVKPIIMKSTQCHCYEATHSIVPGWPSYFPHLFSAVYEGPRTIVVPKSSTENRIKNAKRAYPHMTQY